MYDFLASMTHQNISHNVRAALLYYTECFTLDYKLLPLTDSTSQAHMNTILITAYIIQLLRKEVIVNLPK